MTEWNLEVKIRIKSELADILKRIPVYPNGDGCADEISGYLSQAIDRIEHDDEHGI